MEFDSGIPMSRPPVTAEVSSSLSPPLNEGPFFLSLFVFVD